MTTSTEGNTTTTANFMDAYALTDRRPRARAASLPARRMSAPAAADLRRQNRELFERLNAGAYAGLHDVLTAFEHEVAAGAAAGGAAGAAGAGGAAEVYRPGASTALTAAEYDGELRAGQADVDAGRVRDFEAVMRDLGE